MGATAGDRPKAEHGNSAKSTPASGGAFTGMAMQRPRPAVVHTTDRRKVLDAVRTILADGPTRGRSPLELVTSKEVLEATGLERGAVDRELRRAVDAGQLTNPERGRYGTPDPQ